MPSTEKAPFAALLQKPSDGLETGDPPYHGTTQATGRNRRQRFCLVSAPFAPVRLATGCDRLRPLGSIKAPSSVYWSDYARLRPDV
jgi:hypothetical protein